MTRSNVFKQHRKHTKYQIKKARKKIERRIALDQRKLEVRMLKLGKLFLVAEDVAQLEPGAVTLGKIPYQPYQFAGLFHPHRYQSILSHKIRGQNYAPYVMVKTLPTVDTWDEKLLRRFAEFEDRFRGDLHALQRDEKRFVTLYLFEHADIMLHSFADYSRLLVRQARRSALHTTRLINFTELAGVLQGFKQGILLWEEYFASQPP